MYPYSQRSVTHLSGGAGVRLRRHRLVAPRAGCAGAAAGGAAQGVSQSSAAGDGAPGDGSPVGAPALDRPSPTDGAQADGIQEARRGSCSRPKGSVRIPGACGHRGHGRRLSGVVRGDGGGRRLEQLGRLLRVHIAAQQLWVQRSKQLARLVVVCSAECRAVALFSIWRLGLGQLDQGQVRNLR